MKAKEWVDRFKVVPVPESVEGSEPVTAEARYAEVLAEFVKEMAELVSQRTKGSTPESKYPAAEGAVREKANQFRSICSSVPDLTGVTFENLVMAAAPDYYKWKAAAEKKKDTKRGGEDDVREYRKQKRRERT